MSGFVLSLIRSFSPVSSLKRIFSQFDLSVGRELREGKGRKKNYYFHFRFAANFPKISQIEILTTKLVAMDDVDTGMLIALELELGFLSLSL